jgi:hypothetical protein
VTAAVPRVDTPTAVLVTVLWVGMLALMAWDPGNLGRVTTTPDTDTTPEGSDHV